MSIHPAGKSCSDLGSSACSQRPSCEESDSDSDSEESESDDGSNTLESDSDTDTSKAPGHMFDAHGVIGGDSRTNDSSDCSGSSEPCNPASESPDSDSDSEPVVAPVL